MNKTILVTYASRAGSTHGVAMAIGKTLETQGFTVDVLPMQDVHHIETYDAVIAGSAIRMDNWLPEALQFIEDHQQTLSQKPFAAFVVCLAMAVQNETRKKKATATASGYLQPVRDRVPIISEGLFAGVLNLSKLPLVYRIPFKVVTLLRLFKEGDYRDWNAIHQWALDLSKTLIMPLDVAV